MSRTALTISIGLFILTAACNSVPQKKSNSSYFCLVSSDGTVTAHCLKFYGNGGGRTFIEKGRLVKSTIVDARPLAWHPTRNLLVMKESAADDDCQVFLLDIERGEWEPEGNRLDYIIESTRWVDRISWRDRGRTMVLWNSMNRYEPRHIRLN